MKKHIVQAVLAVALLCICAAQDYKLYHPTESMNDFIKLDTRNGTMTQFTVNNSTNRLEVTLNDTPLVAENEQKAGRFELYPTADRYKFVLLDTVFRRRVAGAVGHRGFLPSRHPDNTLTMCRGGTPPDAMSADVV